MEFHHLEAFVAAAKAHSFTRASKKLNLTQSAISQSIRSLERELGYELFFRNEKSVDLTPFGESLLPDAIDIIRRRQAFGTILPANQKDISGSLSLGTSAAATTFIWSRLYHSFASEYRYIELDIRTTAVTEETISAVTTGELEVGFVPLPTTQRKLVETTLGSHEFLLVLAPGLQLAQKKRISTKVLGDQRWILYDPGTNGRHVSDRFFEERNISPNVVMTTNDTHLIKEMTRLGFGVSLLPDWAIRSEVEDNTLAAITLRGQALRQNLGAIHAAGGLSPAGHAFINYCLERTDLLPASVARK